MTDSRNRPESMKSGVLYLVPTPIGNLSDISERAIRTLREVDEIYAEDTRETLKLLKRFGIENAVHTYLGGYGQKVEEILQKLKSGKRIALVADRGTPCINDPGFEIVKKAHECDIRVVPLPGPNAALTALEASGFNADRFLYLGFIPKKGRERQAFLKRIADSDVTVVFYESPKRILKTLKELMSLAGKDRPVVIARELTKINEEILRKSLGKALEELENRGQLKGEFVIVVSAAERKEGNLEEALKLAKMLAAEGLPKKKASKIASQIYGVSQKDVYGRLV